MDHTSSEAPTTRSDQVRSGAEEGGTVWVNGASRTLVLWQVLGLLVRAGVEESMVSELLSLELCVYYVCIVWSAYSVPKISRARNSVGLDRSSLEPSA